jgi:hypothetical protein
MIYDSRAWGMKDSQKEKVIWNEEEQSRVTDEPVELITWGGTITESEKISKIQNDIKTLLLMCHESSHYGVMKIDLKRGFGTRQETTPLQLKIIVRFMQSVHSRSINPTLCRRMKETLSPKPNKQN